MHGHVERAREQRLVDLLGEEALAAEVAHRPVLDGIARGRQDDDFGRPAQSPFLVGRHERCAHGFSLRPRELRAARADFERTIVA